MTCRTLLVHASNEKTMGDVADVAVTLAKEQSVAHVIGLYVIPGLPAYPGMTMGVMSDIMDNHQQQHIEHARKIQDVFERAMAAVSVASEWRVDESMVPSVAGPVIEHGRAADLIIIEQPDDRDLDFDRREFAGRMVMDAGRPLLIVPRERRFKSMGESVLLAWNGRREAARAVFDALPLLQKAKTISVVCVNPPQDQNQDASLAGTDIATTLARHGVQAETIRDVARGTSVGQELLTQGADIGCDLIVMGGYGHSRFREFVLGGATRHVLDHMTVPVLMSH